MDSWIPPAPALRPRSTRLPRLPLVLLLLLLLTSAEHTNTTVGQEQHKHTHTQNYPAMMKAASKASKQGKVANSLHDKTFTPRAAAAASMQIIDIDPTDHCLDPARGGGFYTYCTSHTIAASQPSTCGSYTGYLRRYGTFGGKPRSRTGGTPAPSHLSG